jgi:hypothetical protein
MEKYKLIELLEATESEIIIDCIVALQSDDCLLKVDAANYPTEA